MLTPIEEISRGCQIGFRINSSIKNPNSEFVNQCHKKNIILRYVGENGNTPIKINPKSIVNAPNTEVINFSLSNT